MTNSVTTKPDSLSDGEGGWRPIETAPKDGTEILMSGRYRTVVAWWGDINAADSEFGTVEHQPHWGWLGHGDCKNGPVWLRLQTYVNPTHWMPLPAPPGSEAPVAKESAAPDLLEALKGMNAAVDAYWNADPRNREPEIKALRAAQVASFAAIAKAEAAS